MYVTSIASVACVLGISVFLVNRSGMLSSTVNQASEKQSLLSTDRVTEEYSEESYNGAISFEENRANCNDKMKNSHVGF